MNQILNGYIQNGERSTNNVKYNKKNFIPFVDERDHLGNLIDSNIRTELGNNSYVKKMLVFHPRKSQDKIEIRDDVPRRWIERSEYKDSPKTRNKQGSYEGLHGSFNTSGLRSLPDMRITAYQDITISEDLNRTFTVNNSPGPPG